jgi:hypothetical protein
MAPDKATLEDLTGYLGLGALELLGFFFVLDGISGFLVFLETYAKTSSWAILVTIPVLVVSYILGLTSSLAVESALRFRPILTPELFARTATSKNETLIRRYAEVERHSRLLNGCLVAFLFLGFGSLAEVRMMGTFGFVGYLGFGIALFLTALCPLVARHQQRLLLPYIHAIHSLPKDA